MMRVRRECLRKKSEGRDKMRIRRDEKDGK